MNSSPSALVTEAERPPRVAAITMARDEADMLPRWVEYYGKQLGLENLIVLDDNTVDGSTDDLPCTVYRLPQPPWKATWAQTRKRMANGLARGLLACFDVVIFTDVDEFLVPDPGRYSGLLDYIGKCSQSDVIAALAVNVLHDPRVEPALRRGQPVLGQRRFVKFAPGMCKPLIKRVPADWTAGFHGVQEPFNIDRELLLLHLKYYDIDTLAKVAEQRRCLYETEGRGNPASAWALGSDELRSRLMLWTERPVGQSVPAFDPSEPDLTDVVRGSASGYFRARGKQLESMAAEPLRQLPERFRQVL